MRNLPNIASLWIGGKLSWLEQLCLKSFADAGHRITLYSYEDIPNVPEGVLTASAEDVFPAEPMYRHARTGSPAIHADLFRMHLLKTTDNIWVDADVYCYRPFNFESAFVYGWEKPGLVCNAVLGLPSDSATLTNMMAFFKDEYAIAPWLKPWQQRELQAEKDAGRPVHMTEQNWGFTGPGAVTHFLKDSGEIEHALPETAFYPIPFKTRNHLILRRHSPENEMTDGTYGVHFWARRMKPRLEEKEGGVPQPGSFMAGLIEKHGIDPYAAPIPPKAKTDPRETATPEYCAELALEALRGDVSPDMIARQHNVEPKFVKECLATLRERAAEIFRK